MGRPMRTTLHFPDSQLRFGGHRDDFTTGTVPVFGVKSRVSWVETGLEDRAPESIELLGSAEESMEWDSLRRK
jgi:hypothetical protein